MVYRRHRLQQWINKHTQPRILTGQMWRIYQPTEMQSINKWWRLPIGTFRSFYFKWALYWDQPPQACLRLISWRDLGVLCQQSLFSGIWAFAELCLSRCCFPPPPKPNHHQRWEKATTCVQHHISQIYLNLIKLQNLYCMYLYTYCFWRTHLPWSFCQFYVPLYSSFPCLHWLLMWLTCALFPNRSNPAPEWAPCQIASLLLAWSLFGCLKLLTFLCVTSCFQSGTRFCFVDIVLLPRLLFAPCTSPNSSRGPSVKKA